MARRESRKISDVEVFDVEKRRVPSKHYVYKINVTWSEGNSLIAKVIYRRYSRFFDFQHTLLEKFPEESGQLDPSKRVIPFLPGKIFFGRSHIRDVALKRLSQIDEYCKTLISLEEHISQCDEVLEFFDVEHDDLNPPASDEKKKTANFGASKISGPKLAEQYKVIADYQKEDKWDLNLKAGTEVEVVEKSESDSSSNTSSGSSVTYQNVDSESSVDLSGWWFVNVEDQQGWVPSTYLKRKDGATENTSQRAASGQEETYMCTEDYRPQNPDELGLEKGTTVDVIEKNLDGWWWIRYQGKEGWAPATYLMKSEKVHMELAAKESGVEIVGQLSDISNLMKGEGNSSDGVTPARPKPPKVQKKSLSLERGGSLRPPPRKNSIKNIDLNAVNPQKLASKNYVTLADFKDTVGDGISFKKGDFVQVIEKTDDGWWFVKIKGVEGWAPSTYIGSADIGDVPEDSEDPEYSSVPSPSDDEEDDFFDDDDDDENQYEDVDPDNGYEIPCSKDNAESDSKKSDRNQRESIASLQQNENTNDANPPIIREKPTLPKLPQQEVVMRNSALPGGKMPRGKDVKRPTSKPPPPPVITVSKEEKKEEDQDKFTSNTANLRAQLEARFSSASSSLSESSVTSKHSPPLLPSKPKEGRKQSNTSDTLAEILKSNFERRQSSASEGASSGSSNDGHFHNHGPVPRPKPSTPPKSDKVERLSKQEENSELANILKAKFEGRHHSEDSVPTPPVAEKTKKHPPQVPLLPPKPAGYRASEAVNKDHTDSRPAERKISGPIFEGDSKPSSFRMTGKKNSIKPVKKPPAKPLKPNLANRNKPVNTTKKEEIVENSIPKSGFAKELAAKLSHNLPPPSNSAKRESVATDRSSVIKPAIPKKTFPTSAALPVTEVKVKPKKKLFRALADYRAQSDSEISFSEGDLLEVGDENEGWWLVTIGRRQGWAPETYIAEVDSANISKGRTPSPVFDSGFTSPEEGSNSSSTQWYRTCANFSSQGEGELGFSEGEFAEILDSSEDDWWYVKINNIEGWVPADYLEKA